MMSSKLIARKYSLVAIMVVGMVVACSTVAGSMPAFEAKVSQDQALQRLGEAFITAGKADGLSIAVIENGDISFLNFGTVSRTTVQRPTETTVYEIGSITKVFTSLLLAHAVTDGRVNLQDDIRRYLHGEYPNLEFEGSPVRLVHLAEMTSGLPDNIPDLAPFIEEGGMDRTPFLISDRWTTYSNADLLIDLRTAELLDRPGAASRHSNVAATLLGIILETVYDEPYENLVSRYIEAPYGIGLGTGEDRALDLAPGYNSSHLAMPALGGRYILSAGGLRYSSADMARFVLAQLGAADDAVRLSQQATGGEDHAAVGFNWRISTSADSGRVLRTSGGTFGASSYVEIRPDLDYGIVLLTNRSGAEGALHELAEQAFQRTGVERGGTERPAMPVDDRAVGEESSH